MAVFVGMAMLTTDVGRAHVVKIELRRAADAAARAGALNLPGGSLAAIADAKRIAGLNRADNRILPAAAITAEVGKWDAATKTLRPPLGGETANAVRVQLSCASATGNPVPSTFASMLGLNPLSVTAEAIAVYEPGVNVDQVVEGTTNPFLSGMPIGSVASRVNPHNSPDRVGSNVPVVRSVTMPIVAGQELEFDEIEGTVRHDPNLAYYTPDGNLGSIGHNWNPQTWTAGGDSFYNENGIADMRAPINALVGVFLSNAAPGATPAPSRNLDFDDVGERNFTSLQPQVKQIFFIGDGRTDSGQRQRFIVPTGATRLYLATWDFYEWNNNAGSRTVRITRPGRVILVK